MEQEIVLDFEKIDIHSSSSADSTSSYSDSEDESIDETKRIKSLFKQTYQNVKKINSDSYKQYLNEEEKIFFEEELEYFTEIKRSKIYFYNKKVSKEHLNGINDFINEIVNQINDFTAQQKNLVNKIKQNSVITNQDLISLYNENCKEFNNKLFGIINFMQNDDYNSLVNVLTSNTRLVTLPDRKNFFINCKDNKRFCIAYTNAWLKRIGIQIKEYDNKLKINEIEVSLEKYNNFINCISEMDLINIKENDFKQRISNL